MIHLGQKIDKIAQKKGFTVRDIANHLQKSEKAVYDIFKKEHLNTEILFLLSALFDMPITHFFEDVEVQSLPTKNAPALPTELDALIEQKVYEVLARVGKAGKKV